MRGALRVAVLGVLLVLVAAASDVEALYGAGIALTVLALLSAAWVWASSRGLRVSRTVPAKPVSEDEPFAVTVSVRGGAVPVPGATVRDGVRSVPVAVRLRRRRAVDAAAGGRGATDAGPGAAEGGLSLGGRPAARAAGETTVHAAFADRGRHTLGPASVTVSDPFGLASRTVGGAPLAAADRVLVLPRLAAVSAARAGALTRRAFARRGAGRGVGAENELDGLRPHRDGTPASRIHWPAYARGAGLLERQRREEGDGLPRVTLEPQDGTPAAEYDETVRATATRIVLLARAGGVSVLLPGDRRPATVGRTLAAWPGVHARLALVGRPAGDQRPIVVDAPVAKAQTTAGGSRDRHAPPAVRDRPRWWCLAAYVVPAIVSTVTWAALLRPHRNSGLFAALALGVLLGAVVLWLGTAPPSRRRAAALAGVVVVGGVGAQLCAGLPVRVLLPTGWGELFRGLTHGVGSTPGVRVPYRHFDEWVRWTMILGGTSLLVLGALLASWPRRGGGAGLPVATVAVTVVLYASGIVSHTPPAPYWGGALVALGLLALLRGRTIVARPGAAAALTGLALAAALLLAPTLDAGHGWFAAHGSGDDGDTAMFNWNHTYSRLDWPRTGKTVLTITTRRAAYWKATNLDEFDGREWRQVSDPLKTYDDEGMFMLQHPEWVQGVQVSVGALDSRQFIGAGTTLVTAGDGLPAIPSGQGTFMTAPGSPLSDGDAYTTTGYVPHPSSAQLRRAGAAYPPSVQADAQLVLPAKLQVGYRRTIALAAEIRAQATSPYDLVRRVIRRVQEGATYSDDPGAHRLPLDAFLFDERRGYCQQFSGATALLLRLAGVPARVSTGFATGLEADAGGTGEKVFTVADTDAHSWVEVYFPGYGWVTFDPTPSSGPARTEPSVAAPIEHVAKTAPALAQTSGSKHTTATPKAAPAPAPVWPWIFAGAVVLVALAGGLLTLVRRRRRLAALPPADAAMLELTRALRRAGFDVPAGTTLAVVERQLDGASGAGAARGYLRALRDARYAGRGSGPSSADRRALRRALAGRGGPWRRLRSWWALA